MTNRSRGSPVPRPRPPTADPRHGPSADASTPAPETRPLIRPPPTKPYVTKTGRVLTDADIDALVDQVAGDIDVATIKQTLPRSPRRSHPTRRAERRSATRPRGRTRSGCSDRQATSRRDPQAGSRTRDEFAPHTPVSMSHSVCLTQLLAPASTTTQEAPCGYVLGANRPRLPDGERYRWGSELASAVWEWCRQVDLVAAGAQGPAG